MVAAAVSPAESTTSTGLEDPRYQIQNSEPSQTVTVGNDTRSYYSFNHVFGRPAGIAVVGAGGFIGKFIAEHVPASEAAIVSCSLSRDAAKAKDQAQAVGLRADQVAASYQELIKNPNVDVVIVASDNASHFEIAKAALENGKHVICEKPVAVSVAQAKELDALAKTMGVEFSLNHFYAQYSLVSTLSTIVGKDPADRSLVIDPSFLTADVGIGTEKIAVNLGNLLDVRGSYLQDWVLQVLRGKREEAAGAELKPDLGIWRLDPKRQGPSCAYGDIGVHVVEVLSHILGSLPTGVSNVKLTKEAEGHTFPLDVRAQAEVTFANGIKATTVASQIDQGTHNDLAVELEFEGGTLRWCNREANVLIFQGPATGNKPVRLERDRQSLAGISAEAEILKTVVQGHDQGHGHAQTKLMKLFLDRVCRNHLASAGKEIVGQPAYIPSGALGIAEMEVVEAVAKG